MRDFYIIAGLCIIFILGGAILYFHLPLQKVAATGDASKPLAVSGNTVEFTQIKAGSNAPDSMGKGNYRITTPAELGVLWTALYGSDAPKPPNVDFSRKEVLAIFDESHATGGYSVSVQSITDTDSARSVILLWASPSDTCQVTQEISVPYTIVLVPKTSLKVTHIDATTVNSCQQ
jgi:hypothetical protein